MFSALYLLLSLVASCLCDGNDVGLRPGYCGKGYFGLFCGDKCPYPTYGLYCRGTCRCSQHLCSFTDGCPINCPAGLTGKQCEIPCTYPFYGYGCQRKCLCSKERCHISTGCYNSRDHSAVKPGPELQTNLTLAVPVTSKKTTKSSTQTLNTVTEGERKSAGTNCVTFTSDSSSEEINTSTPGSGEHIKTSSNYTFSTQVDNADEKYKRDCSGLKDQQNENSSGFWPFRFSRNRGITISLMVLFSLLILSLIGHLVIFIVRRVIKRKDTFPSNV